MSNAFYQIQNALGRPSPRLMAYTVMCFRDSFGPGAPEITGQLAPPGSERDVTQIEYWKQKFAGLDRVEQQRFLFLGKSKLENLQSQQLKMLTG